MEASCFIDFSVLNFLAFFFEGIEVYGGVTSCGFSEYVCEFSDVMGIASEFDDAESSILNKVGQVSAGAIIIIDIFNAFAIEDCRYMSADEIDTSIEECAAHRVLEIFAGFVIIEANEDSIIHSADVEDSRHIGRVEVTAAWGDDLPTFLDERSSVYHTFYYAEGSIFWVVFVSVVIVAVICQVRMFSF